MSEWSAFGIVVAICGAFAWLVNLSGRGGLEHGITLATVSNRVAWRKHRCSYPHRHSPVIIGRAG